MRECRFCGRTTYDAGQVCAGCGAALPPEILYNSTPILQQKLPLYRRFSPWHYLWRGFLGMLILTQLDSFFLGEDLELLLLCLLPFFIIWMRRGFKPYPGKGITMPILGAVFSLILMSNMGVVISICCTIYFLSLTAMRINRDKVLRQEWEKQC